MVQALSVSNIVNVTLSLARIAAQPGNFGTLLTLTDSPAIDQQERLRTYTDSLSVGLDHGTSSPVFAAANLYFSQKPRPKVLYVGRWVRTDAAGILRGTILNPTQRALANFTAVKTGALKLSINGTLREVTGLDFSSATNINGVASILQSALAALAAGTTVKFDAVQSRFILTAPSAGTASVLLYPVAPSAGVNVAALFGLNAAQGALAVPGVAAEALIDAVLALADASSEWYGLTVATDAIPEIDDQMAVSAYIEGSERARIFASTIVDTTVLDPTNNTDLGSVAKDFGYRRTLSQYSSSSIHAINSLIGRMFTVNFKANRSTITLKFKNEPGVKAERLTQTQANTLKAKNVNVFVQYANDTAIIQQGVMADGTFADEVHGLDWLVSEIQTEVFNELAQSTTKIPQTDAGMMRIANAITRACERGVNNGLLAPGQWNGDPVGTIETGDMLATGFAVIYGLVADQAQADREARHAVPFQVLVKLAGAVHDVDVLLTVNR
ncbi:DUF3383 domain-containing protein [Methylobacterium sp. CCH5-D2]|uniref:DUF3383 domain-containing protein n=1 Tax=Methylobacterium sp. CCH5-D2 TaxID=1768765 RepID=UPI00082EBDD0|nr:DUF3383 domain-containing protein [Methylobacterium sp. CCH5-D2]